MPVHGFAASEPKALLAPHTYEPTALGPFDVDIAISHCGICHSDLHLIDDDWAMSKYPLVPGHEVVGTVREAGPLVTGLSASQRVGVGWQAGACFQCEWCMTGDEPSCVREVATCVGRPGGFADAIRVDSRFAFPIPDSLDAAATAPLLCAGATVYSPLRRHARPGTRVGVIGIGGLGHLALRFAHAFGCEVTAFSTSAPKEEEARRLGAHRFVISTDQAQMDAAKGTIDLLLSTVMVPQDWAAWFSVLRLHGALCLLGAPPALVTVSPVSLVIEEKSVFGSKIGTRAMIREMLEFAARHRIGAQVEVLPIAHVNDAIGKVRRNEARYRMVLAVR